jgi:MoxR-like ATPase
VLSYEALAEGLTADQIVQKVMGKVARPDKPMQHAAEGAARG